MGKYSMVHYSTTKSTHFYPLKNIRYTVHTALVDLKILSHNSSFLPANLATKIVVVLITVFAGVTPE